MQSSRGVLLFAVLSALIAPALAYKQSTHGYIEQYAAQASELNKASSQILETLRLGADVSDGQYRLPSTFSPLGSPLRMTPKELMIQGVYDEDDAERSLNHFYDPQQGGIPLSGTGAGLFRDIYRSPRWALEDEGPIAGQDFSYRDAKTYLRVSLTNADKATRERNLGLMFESLGHVSHHLQDMNQPQHVRNDDHCDETKPLFTAFGHPSPSVCQLSQKYRPSSYEHYVGTLGGSLPYSGYPTPDFATYSLPSAFWVNSGMGNAEFTSNNFVTVRTNFKLSLESTPGSIRSDDNHPYPRGEDAVLVNLDINSLEPLRPGALPMAGHLSYVETPVIDKYSPAFSVHNQATSSLSIWYDALELGTGEPAAIPSYAFTLNQVNYEAALQRLVPRASAFSVALVNYFFRGRIEITTPDSGIYAVIDHATANQAGRGFSKLRLKLRNATPAAIKPSGGVVQQEMSPGTLTAIAKFMPNGCYLPDLLGEYDGSTNFAGPITRSGCSLLDYFTGQEKVIKSATLAAVGLDRENAQEFTFDFSQQPIPIDAHDLYIQIVYEGKLGSEHDAIVVAGTNLSEPTYLSVMNGSDHFAIDDKLYTPDYIRSQDNLKNRVQGVDIDPEPLSVEYVINGLSVAGPVSIQEKEHTRLAVLADAEVKPPLVAPPSIQLQVRWQFPSSSRLADSLPTKPIRNQLARAPGVLSEIGIVRGVTYWQMLYLYKAVGFPDPTIETIEALPSVAPGCATSDPQKPTCAPAPTAIPIASSFQ